MTADSSPVRRRVAPFLPARSRVRVDGWTPARQAMFLGKLAELGSVARAARAVGLSRASVYALRRRSGAESFAEGWDRALGKCREARRKLTLFELQRRAGEGLLKPVLRNGRYVRTEKKADNSALLSLVRQLDHLARDAAWG